MFYTEKERKINAVKTDVLIVGSGPAGIGAAISASRLGVKVTVVEKNGCLGGISTAGMMSHWTGDCDSNAYREILRESASLNEGAFKNKITATIDTEKLKYQYLKTLYEAGVEIMLYTFAGEPITESGTVKGVVVENKSGRTAIFADVTIDASGDGDVAAKAGVPFVTGREEDGKMQPATLMVKVGGVDKSIAVLPHMFECSNMTEKGEIQTLAKKILPYPAGHVLLYDTTLPGTITVNMTNAVDIDGTKNEDLVKAEITCRGQIDKIIAFLREYVPGFDKCYLLGTASLIGIRETRHFRGKYTLTGEDITQAKIFDDWIVKGACFNFDIHNVSGSGLDRNGKQKDFPINLRYTIPYRCFLPEKIKGLLLCGRNISGTHLAHSNFRVMPICAGMGEGCGAAAAYAVKYKTDLNDVNLEKVQKYLMDGSIF